MVGSQLLRRGRADRRRVHGEIETPARERQWVITQTHEGSISEANMDCQLSEPTSQESV